MMRVVQYRKEELIKQLDEGEDKLDNVDILYMYGVLPD